MGRSKALALAALLAASAGGIAGEAPQVESREMGGGLYLLAGSGYNTNIGLMVGRNAAVLIDPSPGSSQLDALHDVVRGVVGDLEVFIVNTHDHPDHAGGNDFLTGKGMHVVKDGAALPLGLERFDVVSHSQRDTLIFDPVRNVVFTGDVFDNSWHPTFYAGGIAGLTDAIEAILALGDEQTLIVPGHGAPANKAALRAFHRNTLDWVDRVNVLRAEGLSVDQTMVDPGVLEIVARFDTRGREPFLSEASLRRFIERTLVAITQADAKP